ncbi:hypothetical protein B0T22DRAFT_169856 [Podospora appendiculata]|uniref:Uncharacterized protein n=1 Tax=Podospora appendiculata TaxID=314037 RepID=A0AAE1CD46_9PEZI|nr:hypothetical protein B0T22DRAFT_169856 [Podospora appendiculata]
MADITSEPVPLTPSVRHRFYEPVVFLFCIIAANFKNRTTRTPDLETDDGKSPTDSFRCFVNKLGQICDSERGGDTITAFAVLQPGMIEYRFASNSRDRNALNRVKKYVIKILRMLGDASNEELKTSDLSRHASVFSVVLRTILAFNWPRIELHIAALKQQFGFCADACRLDESEEANSALQGIIRLEHAVGRLSEKRTDEDDNSKVAEEALGLLQTIHELYQSPFAEFLREKARQDRDVDNDSPWTELRHAMGRLYSYYITVKVLVATRKRRPQLFDDFEVNFVPSSGPGETPSMRRNTSGIASRMTSNTAKREAIIRYVDHLKRRGIDVDKDLKDKTQPRCFQPIVHAEVNLLDSILREERESDERTRFYGEGDFGRYIGCSKPTCRLCGLYFQFHPSAGVDVRPSHQNLYYKWRAPDVYEHDGLGAERTSILEKMLNAIREENFRVIQDQAPVRKRHDSHTSPSNPSELFSTRATRMDDVVSSFERVDLSSVTEVDDVEERSESSGPRESLEFSTGTVAAAITAAAGGLKTWSRNQRVHTVIDEDEDGGDDGGAKL